jgi:hypothetical protein
MRFARDSKKDIKALLELGMIIEEDGMYKGGNHESNIKVKKYKPNMDNSMVKLLLSEIDD